jgi:hypothetical protein
LHAIWFPPERYELVQYIAPFAASTAVSGHLVDEPLDAGSLRHLLDQIAGPAHVCELRLVRHGDSRLHSIVRTQAPFDVLAGKLNVLVS